MNLGSFRGAQSETTRHKLVGLASRQCATAALNLLAPAPKWVERPLRGRLSPSRSEIAIHLRHKPCSFFSSAFHEQFRPQSRIRS